MSHKRKKTKIVATLGPAISSKEMLHKMVEAGADILVCGTGTIYRPLEDSISNKIKLFRQTFD